MREYKSNLRTDIARHYFTDACDFLSRFDFLLEDYSKTKRAKCFVDLLMGFECILKSHAFLSHRSNNMEEVYTEIRHAKHNLEKLSDLASYFPGRDLYEHTKRELGAFSVFLRYSLDAYESFFPSVLPRDEAAFDYSKTLANHPWLIEMRNLLKRLIDGVSDEFGGILTFDLTAIIASEERMREFVLRVGIIKA